MFNNSNKVNYKNFSNNKTKVEEPIIEKTIKETEKEKITPEVVTSVTLGSTDARLNLREKPDTGSNVLTILDQNEEITILDKNINEDFYKVVTVHGIEGYCMKKFVTIKE